MPFARLQMLQTPPQACKVTTLTCRPLQTLPQASKATTVCPCLLFFRWFKTAVCPPSNAPNASAGLQGNNSYSYTATAIYTCPCHLFFRGFKTAVCPPSNAPNASASLQGNNSYLQASPNPPAGLQGNNSYSYMPLPSVFQGVQDCRLPAFKCSKRLRRPPRQQLLQLYSYSYIYMPSPSVFQGVQDCRLPAFKCSKRLRRPPRQQLFPAGLSKPSRRPPRQQLSALAICLSRGSRLPFACLQMLQTPPQSSKATTLTAIQLQLYMPLPSVFQGVQDCRLPAFKCPRPSRRPPRQQLVQLHAPAICFSGGSGLPFARLQTVQTRPQASKATTLTAIQLQLYMPLPSVFQGVQDCRLPAFKCSKRLRKPARQQLLPAGLSKPSRRPPRQQLSALAICFSRGSRLPFNRLQMLQTPPQASKATTLTAIQLQLYMPLPSVFQGVQDCRLPAFKCSKRLRRPARQQLLPAGLSKPSRRPPRQQLLQLHALAICFSGGSRLPFARLQMLQTPPQASKATTLPCSPLQTLPQASKATTLCPCHCCLPGFKPSKPFRRLPRQQASKSTTLTATCPCHLFFRGFKTAVCPPSNAPNASAGLQGNNSYSYTATAIYTCPCHLFFRGFKTAVCPPSNAPNASASLQGNNSYLQASPNPPAGLQGNNCLPLPSVFKGVQDCRLPAFKCSKRFRWLPRQLFRMFSTPLPSYHISIYVYIYIYIHIVYVYI